MQNTLSAISKLSALAGMALCLLALVGRFVGVPAVHGFQAIHIFIVGVGAMVFACWMKLNASDFQK